jgi:hypothetical protein
MGKKSRSGPGSGSGLNIPYHISESLETILWVKIIKFFDADAYSVPGIFLTLDPGSWMEKNSYSGSGIPVKHPGSATLIRGIRRYRVPGTGTSLKCSILKEYDMVPYRILRYLE